MTKNILDEIIKNYKNKNYKAKSYYDLEFKIPVSISLIEVLLRNKQSKWIRLFQINEIEIFGEYIKTITSDEKLLEKYRQFEAEGRVKILGIRVEGLECDDPENLTLFLKIDVNV